MQFLRRGDSVEDEYHLSMVTLTPSCAGGGVHEDLPRPRVSVSPGVRVRPRRREVEDFRLGAVPWQTLIIRLPLEFRPAPFGSTSELMLNVPLTDEDRAVVPGLRF